MKPALRKLTRRAVIGAALLGIMVAAASRPQATGDTRRSTEPVLEVPQASVSGVEKPTAQVIRG